jgi:hypothetical protein
MPLASTSPIKVAFFGRFVMPHRSATDLPRALEQDLLDLDSDATPGEEKGPEARGDYPRGVQRNVFAIEVSSVEACEEFCQFREDMAN